MGAADYIELERSAENLISIETPHLPPCRAKAFREDKELSQIENCILLLPLIDPNSVLSR